MNLHESYYWEDLMVKKDILKDLYSGLQDVVVIGLTGRDGSGCSKVAELLNTPISTWGVEVEQREKIEKNYQREQKMLTNYFLTSKKRSEKYFRLISTRDIFVLQTMKSCKTASQVEESMRDLLEFLMLSHYKNEIFGSSDFNVEKFRDKLKLDSNEIPKKEESNYTKEEIDNKKKQLEKNMRKINK